MSLRVLTDAQIEALRIVAEAPLGVWRLSSSHHGTADDGDRIASRSLSRLERLGFVEWRSVNLNPRCFATSAGRRVLEAAATAAGQAELFGGEA